MLKLPDNFYGQIRRFIADSIAEKLNRRNHRSKRLTFPEAPAACGRTRFADRDRKFHSVRQRNASDG